MKIDEIFNQIETQSETSQFTFTNGISVSGNAIWNTETKKVDIIDNVKLLGITLYKNITSLEPDVFFDKLKKSKKQIQIIDNMIEKYTKSIEKAEKFGQTALVEKMKDEIEIVKKETLAVANEINEYLTQEQVEKLIKKSAKNIECDYIKNFARHIPDKLLEKKTKLDGVFDDYIVMHYDPKKSNTDLTKKEKEAKKDPILFGVIKNSRNLYYIGDWIDEYCTLTLKEAVAIIEDKTKKIY